MQTSFDDLRRYLEELQRLNLPGASVLTSHSYIIMCDGIAVNPEIAGRRTTGNVRPGRVHKVARFTEEDALYLAGCVRNGRGVQGEAVVLDIAVEREIETLKMLLGGQF